MQYLNQNNKKQRPLRLIALLLTVLLPLCLTGGSVTAEESTIAAAASQLNAAFTYQGQLKRAGGAFSGNCAFDFGLWDAETEGTAIATQSLDNVEVTNGLFTAQLDFGNQFTGEARWLAVQVKCQDDADYTTMTPRVLLTASPYAIGLMPGSQIRGSIASTHGVLMGVNDAEGAAIVGIALPSTGVTYGVIGNAFSPNGSAVSGYTENGGTAVRGLANDSGYGVYGTSTSWIGVHGESTLFEGVRGTAHHPEHGGVVGVHDGGGIAVYGTSPTGAGVVGKSTSWVGVAGESNSAFGVQGTSSSGSGVVGTSTSWIGVYGESAQYEGVRGLSHHPDHGGVVGVHDGGGIAVYGISNGGYAGFFDGKLGSKTVHILGGADLAEWYNVSSVAGPGTLLVIDPVNPGQLMPSSQAYDSRVAGVVSGAGGVNPGLTLQQEGVLEGDTQVAIAGRVYVRAEAHAAPIQPGDLLTTSDMPGHAMKAVDRELAYGAIIGKALTGLDEGTGLVLVLVSLQ